MKISNWIAENKILILIPVLALVVAVVVVLAYELFQAWLNDLPESDDAKAESAGDGGS